MVEITKISKPHRSGANRWALTRIYWRTPSSVHPEFPVSHEVSVAVCWEPRDLWVGLYWEHNEWQRWVFYLCLLPCLPLRVKYRKH